MEKYGFVYIWRDRKHKRYYIGCHWGTENDGYVCSSRWMTRSYSHRPSDFSRRVLSRFDNRYDMFAEETRMLSFIKNHEVRFRYYNLRITAIEHWSKSTDTTKSVKEKLSEIMKAKHQDPAYREIYLEGQSKRKPPIPTEESRQKRSEVSKKMWAKLSPPEDRLKRSPKGSAEHSDKLSKASLRRWAKPDAKAKQSEVTRKQHIGKKHRLGQVNTSEHNTKISAANSGKVRSPEVKLALSQARLYNYHPECRI